MLFCYLLYANNIPDSKRQQTTTVDYKRLFNGLLLTNAVSLQHQNRKCYDGQETIQQRAINQDLIF